MRSVVRDDGCRVVLENDMYDKSSWQATLKKAGNQSSSMANATDGYIVVQLPALHHSSLRFAAHTYHVMTHARLHSRRLREGRTGDRGWSGSGSVAGEVSPELTSSDTDTNWPCMLCWV